MSKTPLWIAALGVDEGGQAVAHIASNDEPEVERFMVPAPGSSCFEILRWMENGGVQQCWIHESWWNAGERAVEPSSWVQLPGGWACDCSKPDGWMFCTHHGVYGPRSIVIPVLESRADWRDAPDARTLLRAVLRYNAQLGIPYFRSPGATGTALIRKVHSGPGGTRMLVCEHMPEIARTGVEDTILWSRPLFGDEIRGGVFLHGFDKNSQYLGACASLSLGVGDPVHLDGPGTPEHRKCPGYWRITADRRPTTYLPDPLRPTVAKEIKAANELWVTTPTLALAEEIGELYSVYEGYYWPIHHQVLNPWYKILRDAMQDLGADADSGDVAARVARGVVKRTYTMGIGWLAPLGGPWTRNGVPQLELYRPDWRHAVMGQARANFWRNLHKIHADRVLPIAVREDQFYVLSSEADAVRAFPSALKMGRGLGEYKVKLSVPIAFVQNEIEPMRSQDPRERWRAFGRVLQAAKNAAAAVEVDEHAVAR